MDIKLNIEHLKSNECFSKFKGSCRISNSPLLGGFLRCRKNVENEQDVHAAVIVKKSLYGQTSWLAMCQCYTAKSYLCSRHSEIRKDRWKGKLKYKKTGIFNQSEMGNEHVTNFQKCIVNFRKYWKYTEVEERFKYAQ